MTARETLADRRLIVALGATRYRVERPFHAPEGPGGVSDVAVGPDGAVHVLVRTDPLCDPPTDAVIRLTPAGAVTARHGAATILDAHMLGVAPDGRLFVVDRDAHEVVILRDGRRTGGLGTRHEPLAPFNHPTDVAFAPDGTVYVSDGYANARIHRFDPEGRLMTSWGTHGDGPGAFVNPHAVWVQPDGRVIVADRENDRLQVFGPEGEHLAIWTGFVKPLDIWGDAAGRLYVTDFVPSLTLLSPEGARLGQCRPVLNAAHGISGDASGRIYLAEPSPSRVSRLVPVGTN